VRCSQGEGRTFWICGEARDGKEAIEKVIELKPDIILLDINMPVMDGIRAAHEIRLVSPEAKIIFLKFPHFGMPLKGCHMRSYVKLRRTPN
jgi:CheY-like chemotaxis protein